MQVQRGVTKPGKTMVLQMPRRLMALRRCLLVVGVVSVVLLLGKMLSTPLASKHFSAQMLLQLMGPPPVEPHGVALTLWQLASKPVVEPRGIVLPLFDGIAVLGVSMIMDLRELQVDLPIEVPHCGDLDEKLRERLERDEKLNVRVYDVCVEAARAKHTNEADVTQKVFCRNLKRCHERFRSFDIKVISLVFSRFEELMLLDADVLFMQNPMRLWDLDKFKKTGTLFFPDRISFADQFLCERVNVKDPSGKTVVMPERSRLHDFVEGFDRKQFEGLDNVPRVEDKVHSKFKNAGPEDEKKGKPSEYLRNSHAWKIRSGHQADSSVMLWSKTKQARATAIVASFLISGGPPSYGDKEYYFLACEVADSEYAFSDFGVGAIGGEWRENERAVCGDSLHFFPIRSPHIKDDDDIPSLYINSDNIANWDPDKEDFIRTSARPADLYPGSFGERNLPHVCPFDVKPIPLVESEKEAFRRRQRMLKIAETWVEKK